MGTNFSGSEPLQPGEEVKGNKEGGGKKRNKEEETRTEMRRGNVKCGKKKLGNKKRKAVSSSSSLTLCLFVTFPDADMARALSPWCE